MNKCKQAELPSDLEQQFMSPNTPLTAREHWARNEIESLRRRLQDGSPIHEAVVQHMAMEIAALKKELDEKDRQVASLYQKWEDALAKLGADKEE